MTIRFSMREFHAKRAHRWPQIVVFISVHNTLGVNLTKKQLRLLRHHRLHCGSVCVLFAH